MNSSARIKLNHEEYLVDGNQSLENALKTMNIEPESVLAIRDGILIDIKDLIKPGDTIKLVHVISGGNYQSHGLQD